MITCQCRIRRPPTSLQYRSRSSDPAAPTSVKGHSPGAKKALAEIWNAEDKDHARAAVKAFEAASGARFPKATAKITDDADELLAFDDYPAGQ